MGDSMFRRTPARFVLSAVLFVLCQVIGMMCALPNLSEAQETAFIEDRMACPMDGTVMCPPSLTSSPERQVTHIQTLSVEPPTGLHDSVLQELLVHGVPSPWCRGNALSLVPISISSSSVLRI